MGRRDKSQPSNSGKQKKLDCMCLATAGSDYLCICQESVWVPASTDPNSVRCHNCVNNVHRWG